MKFKLSLFALFSFGVLSFGIAPLISCTQENASAQEAFATISGEDAKKAIANDKEVKIIDVRTPEEFASGNIENATNIDFLAPDFEEQLNALPKDKTYIVYCRSGNRSGKAMSVFKKLGFANVKNVAGGISQLK